MHNYIGRGHKVTFFLLRNSSSLDDGVFVLAARQPLQFVSLTVPDSTVIGRTYIVIMFRTITSRLYSSAVPDCSKCE